MAQREPTLSYQHQAKLDAPRPKVAWYGLFACLSAVLTIFFLVFWAAGPSSRVSPFILPAIFFSAATTVIGTALTLLDRRQSPTYAILALCLSATTVLLVCGVMNIGIGAYLWRWIRHLLG
jgi:cytochrome c biogenesis protein CcdA